MDSCFRGPPGRSVEDDVDKLFNPFTRRYFSDFMGLCRGWVRVLPMRNIGFEPETVLREGFVSIPQMSEKGWIYTKDFDVLMINL